MQFVALALNGPDQGLAPPAETDDCRVDHRGWRARLDVKSGGTAEILAKEFEDLVPAVRGLLDPVVWPIPGEEGVARTVIAVELVILAEPLQLGIGAVDLIGRRVRIFVTEEPEQRTVDPGGKIDRRRELSLCHPRLVPTHHITPPATTSPPT